MAIPRGSGAMPTFFAFRAPGRREWGGILRGSGGGQAIANYLCKSRRPGVHTAIICVGRDGREYTHSYQLFMYVGASAARSAPPYSYSIPPPPLHRGSGGTQKRRLAIANYLCRSGHLHVHTQLPIIYVGRGRPDVHTQLPIVYVRGSLRSPN